MSRARLAPRNLRGLAKPVSLNADDVTSLMHVNPSALELASPHQPEQRFSNPCGGKLAACPNDKEPIMAMVFELLTLLSALALGFVLGRIWEIRQEFGRGQAIGNRQRRVDDGFAGQVQAGYRLPTAHL